MTELNTPQQPVHPRSGQKYDLLREAEITASSAESTLKELFTMHITATSEKGANMNNGQQFLIDLIFKPNEPGLKLRPAETQLLLAYIGEILKEVEEADEVAIIEEKYADKEEAAK